MALHVDKYGNIIDSRTDETFIIKGVATAMGEDLLANHNMQELVVRWNEHDKLAEENEQLRDVLHRITATINAGNTKCDGVDFPMSLLIEAEKLMDA